MDPNAALYYFLVGASDGDKQMMEDYHEALSLWLRNGNFQPDWKDTVMKAANNGCYGGNYMACLQKVRQYFKQCPV